MLGFYASPFCCLCNICVNKDQFMAAVFLNTKKIFLMTFYNNYVQPIMCMYF